MSPLFALFTRLTLMRCQVPYGRRRIRTHLYCVLPLCHKIQRKCKINGDGRIAIGGGGMQALLPTCNFTVNLYSVGRKARLVTRNAHGADTCIDPLAK